LKKTSCVFVVSTNLHLTPLIKKVNKMILYVSENWLKLYDYLSFLVANDVPHIQRGRLLSLARPTI